MPVLWWSTLKIHEGNFQITILTSYSLMRGFAAARLLGLRVRIPPGEWMFLSCEYYVLSRKVPASGWSLVQRGPTDCGVSECGHKSSIMIYLFTAIRLTPRVSSRTHIYTQTIHRTTQSTQTIRRTTQLSNWEECERCPVFASYNLAFALQLRKKQGNPSVRVMRWSWPCGAVAPWYKQFYPINMQDTKF